MLSSSRLCLLIALLASALQGSTATAADPIVNQMTGVSMLGSEPGLRWRVTFTQEPRVVDAKAAAKFLKACSNGVVFTEDDPNYIFKKGNSVEITLPTGGMSKSYATVNNVSLAERRGGTESVYSITSVVGPGNPIEKMGTTIKEELALLDATLRGHKVGENDGINLNMQFAPTSGSSGKVTLTYSGGIYNNAK